MIVFRLSKVKYAKDLTGHGAEKAGGRWNNKGTAIIYTGANIALCMAEVAVHIPYGNMPADYCLSRIFVPDNASIEQVNANDLPTGWNYFPHPNATMIKGDNFIKANDHLLLAVPSAVVQGETNYLINPNHSLFAQVYVMEVVPFTFDERLFRTNT